jgi:predicted RNA methylase
MFLATHLIGFGAGGANATRVWLPVSVVTPESFGLKSEDVRWLGLRARLRAVLTDAEWAAAERTTQYAHYTSAPIVRAMWAAAQRFGFAGGAVLEPGAGNGMFPGLMPEGMAASSSYTGIEYDPITGGILKQLQPDEHILVESYVDTKLPRDFFDIAIGNPPFRQGAVLADPEYAKRAFSLHDYFFAKTLDRVKPGGLVMFVSSRFTMDKQSDKARQYLAERADLVGAIRLPQTAFKGNAGTEVVTDVLFLRKKVPGETFEQAQPWLRTEPVKVGDQMVPVNEYFAAHPEMILGTPALVRGMRQANEYSVLPPDGDIGDLFAKAVERMPAGIYKAARGSAAEAAQVREIDFNPKAKKEGNYYVTDAGVLMQREGGVGMRVEGMTPKDQEGAWPRINTWHAPRRSSSSMRSSAGSRCIVQR